MSAALLESGFSSAGTQSEASLVPSISSIPIWKEISYHSYNRTPGSSSGLEKGALVTPKMPDWTFLSHGAPSYVPQWSNHVSVVKHVPVTSLAGYSLGCCWISTWDQDRLENQF